MSQFFNRYYRGDIKNSQVDASNYRKRYANIRNKIVLSFPPKIRHLFTQKKLVNFLAWKINFGSFFPDKKFQLCKVFGVYKKFSLESYFSQALFLSFYPRRWQVIAKIDNFYKDRNMLFNLQCSYKCSHPTLRPWKRFKSFT